MHTSKLYVAYRKAHNSINSCCITFINKTKHQNLMPLYLWFKKNLNEVFNCPQNNRNLLLVSQRSITRRTVAKANIYLIR